MAQNFPQVLSALLHSGKALIGSCGCSYLGDIAFLSCPSSVVHALTAQTVLRTPDWQKGKGHSKGVTDQERNLMAEHQETLHSEFSSVLGLWGVAGRVPDTVCGNCTQHLGNPWREDLLAVDQHVKHAVGSMPTKKEGIIHCAQCSFPQKQGAASGSFVEQNSRQHLGLHVAASLQLRVVCDNFLANEL